MTEGEEEVMGTQWKRVTTLLNTLQSQQNKAQPRKSQPKADDHTAAVPHTHDFSSLTGANIENYPFPSPFNPNITREHEERM